MSWFNPLQHNPEMAPPQLPVGKCRWRIIKTEKKANKDNTGGMLALSLGALDGPNAGTTGVWNLNLWNSNQQASEIAARHLSAVCHVVGVLHDLTGMPEGVELWGKDLMLDVQPQKEGNYTQVVGIFDVNGNPPQRTGAGPQQAAAASPQQFAQQPAPASQPNGAAPAWGGQPSQGAAPGPMTQAPPAAAPAWGGQPQQAAAAPAAPAWSQQPAGAAAPWGQR